MKALTTPTANFGPFVSIEVLSDRYRCDNTDLPFTVVGQGTIVEADTITWPEPVVPPPTTQDRIDFAKMVDAQVDAIYTAVQGERVTEYMLAESDATAYKSAGYAGTVPSSVASWAAAKAKDAKWAADDILATATAWRGAQGAIRAQRLAIKEQVKIAPSLVPLRAQWAGFLAVVKKQLGV